MRITVFLDGADVECCLAVPSVGDAVRWSLAWSDEPDHPAASDIAWAVEQPLLLDEEESRHIGVASGHLLNHGPVSAWWRGDGDRPLPRTGVLEADTHGFVPERVPVTAGRAREISLVLTTVRRNEHGRTGRVPSGTSVWPVTGSDAWRDWEEYAALSGPVPAGHERGPAGVLVVVDVDA